MSARSQRRRSCSSSRMRSPEADVRAARRDSCSSISASRPIASGSGSSSTSRRARRTASPDRSARVSRSAGGRGVALVEHEIDHAQHRLQPLGQLGCAGDFVRDARVADLGLCAHDALRERGRRGEKGVRDLLGLQAAHLAQRQRDLRVGREGGVAAGEDEPQAVVLDFLLDGLLGGERFGVLLLERVEARAAANRVDRLEAPGGYQPRARVLRKSFPWPLLERRAKRLVQRFLGKVEIAEQAHQRCKHAARFGPVDALDRPGDGERPHSGSLQARVGGERHRPARRRGPYYPRGSHRESRDGGSAQHRLDFMSGVRGLAFRGARAGTGA